jgi:hypothetical protein
MNQKTYFKITGTKITTSKRGYTIYNLQLNNRIWATKLAPVRKIDEHSDFLYLLCKKENGSINSLVGKYIFAEIVNTQYGYQIELISSFDIITEFQKLLDDNKGVAFSTQLPIYDFLNDRGCTVEPDCSIRLKSPYDYYHILKKYGSTVCFKKTTEKNILNFENIHIIFDTFFKGKEPPEWNIDDITRYALRHTAIVESGHRTHKTTGKKIRSIERDVLRIGDPLPNEYIEFLNGVASS